MIHHGTTGRTCTALVAVLVVHTTGNPAPSGHRHHPDQPRRFHLRALMLDAKYKLSCMLAIGHRQVKFSYRTLINK
jgi:hypothetical protein